jgi:hypothetical protein
MDKFFYGKRGDRRGRRRLVTLSLCLAVFLGASVVWAQWPVTVQPGPNASGWGKSAGLQTAFLGTLDVSAELSGSNLVSPDEAGTGCPAACGDVKVKFSSTSPFAIHVSSVTLGIGSNTCVIFYDGTFPQAVDVTVPANGQSATATIPDVVEMPGNAPVSCANTVFEFPITNIQAQRV